MRECVTSEVINAAPYILWQYFLDIQERLSYTASRKKQVLINQFNLSIKASSYFIAAKATGYKREVQARAFYKFNYDIRLTNDVIKSIEQTALFLRENNILKKDVDVNGLNPLRCTDQGNTIRVS